MSIELADFLDVEAFAKNALLDAWSDYASDVQDRFDTLMSANDIEGATEVANGLSTSTILPVATPVLSAALRASIGFGASLVNSQHLTSSLNFDRAIKAQLSQVKHYLEYGFVAALHRQLMAQIEASPVVKKAEALRPLVKFKDRGDALLEMTATLHAARLSGWGFVAEADLIGVTEYKLSAQLDNRTSEFCRLIHGRVFKVEDARPLLDTAVYSDNPDDLKTIHPWPKQTKTALGALSRMSDSEIVANRYHVPPFHPGCRTMMIATKTVSRITKPKQVDQDVVESDKEDFNFVGVKVSDKQLGLWNDYIQVKPSTLLQAFTGKLLKDIAGVGKGMLKITPKGYIHLVDGKKALRFSTGTGRMLTDMSNSDLVDNWPSMESTVRMMGASTLETTVASGYAETLLGMGFVPAQSSWAGVQRHLKKLIAAGAVSGPDLQVLTELSVGTSPKAFSRALALSRPAKLVVLRSLSYKAQKAFDDTGLS